jgi:hypothetical protein
MLQYAGYFNVNFIANLLHHADDTLSLYVFFTSEVGMIDDAFCSIRALVTRLLISSDPT